MRYLILTLFVIGIIIFIANSYTKFKKNASIKGVVYIEINSDKVKPIRNLPIYLIKGEIRDQIENMKEDYRNNILTREEQVKLYKKYYNEKEEILERDLVTLKSLESINRKDNLYYEIKKKYEGEKEGRNQLYKKYYGLLEEFSFKRSKYNELFEELINKNFYRKTKTDDKGRYTFKDFRKGHYYVYAIEGSLVNTNVWFIEVNLNENKVINLSKKNAGDIFR
jgi:hypothetical protein